MTMDEVLELIQKLSKEQPRASNYRQILGDSFRVVWEIAKAVKELQDAKAPPS